MIYIFVFANILIILILKKHMFRHGMHRLYKPLMEYSMEHSRCIGTSRPCEITIYQWSTRHPALAGLPIYYLLSTNYKLFTNLLVDVENYISRTKKTLLYL